MKYIVSVILSMSIMGFAAQAAVGDVAGKIYTTDIAADIDGMPIKSYNIGGKTAIVIEELREYGFSVEWKPEERLLIANAGCKPYKAPEYVHIKKTPGKVAGKIYETDIKVLFNGILVPSYNIGGLTAVAIEDMTSISGQRYSYDGNALKGLEKPFTDLGIYHIWNQENRTISLYTLRPGNTIKTEYGELVLAGDKAERISYIKSTKSLTGMDGRYYASYTDGLSINGKMYFMLSELEGIFGGRVSTDGEYINLDMDLKNALELKHEDVYEAQDCSNIIYPIKAKLSVNQVPANSGDEDFYLYKGDVFVSQDALNKASGKVLLRDINALPDGITKSLGKIMYSEHILYVNGRAIPSYLADNGKYYIPVDALSEAKFDIISSLDMRDIKTPCQLPDIVMESGNYPTSYFLEDTDKKGYLCEYYQGIHKVLVDGKELPTVYIHFYDTYLTPCIDVEELVGATGYAMEKKDSNIYVYTRKDRLTVGLDKSMSAIVLYKNREAKKEFSLVKYFGILVYGDYVYVPTEVKGKTINEVYSTDSLKYVAEIAGIIFDVSEDVISTYEDIEENGEWIRKYSVYDKRGKLLETYTDKM